MCVRNEIIITFMSPLKIFVSGIVLSLVSMILGIFLFRDLALHLGLASFFIFTVCGVLSVKMDLAHPFVWFNIPFALYSVAGPILYLTTGFPKDTNFPEVIGLEYVALLVFSIFVGCRRVSYKNVNFEKFADIANGNRILLLLWIILACVFLYAVLSSGMTNKQDRNVSFSPVFMIDFVFFFMNVSICILLIRDFTSRNARRMVLRIGLFGVLFMTVLLIAGARGVLYRFVIMVIVTYSIFYKKIPIKYLILIALMGMYVQGFLGGMKMFFITREIGIDVDYTMDYETIVRNLFGSEVGTPSINLAIVLDHMPNEMPYLFGKSLLWDLQRAFIPGFLFSRDLFSSTAGWFTKTFFENVWWQGGGVGFSMVGVGYVNFGIYGVVALFAVIGLSVRKLYHMSSKTIISCLFYLCFIPIFIYAIRSDLSIPIAQGLKHTLFPILCAYMLGHVLYQIKSTNLKTTKNGDLF